MRKNNSFSQYNTRKVHLWYKSLLIGWFWYSTILISTDSDKYCHLACFLSNRSGMSIYMLGGFIVFLINVWFWRQWKARSVSLSLWLLSVSCKLPIVLGTIQCCCGYFCCVIHFNDLVVACFCFCFCGTLKKNFSMEMVSCTKQE